MVISKKQARNAQYIYQYKAVKDSECVDANGPGSEYNLSTGQCE
jgi:hypothetical protein